MSNANKNKGKRFEREVAEMLTNAFGLNFCRVPNSGAFVGGQNSFRRSNLSPSQESLMTGDIIVPEELFHITLECKNYKEFSFASLFTENKLLDKWIEQAKHPVKFWFLIFKINREGAFVVFDSRLLSYLRITGNNMLYKDAIILPLEQFFELNKDQILNLWKNSVKYTDGAQLSASEIVPPPQ